MTKYRILDVRAFLHGLGDLHDSRITIVSVDAEAGATLIEIEDILANFQDGQGAAAPLKAVLIFKNAEPSAELPLLIAEQKFLWIWECLVTEAQSSLVFELKFVPEGVARLHCTSIDLVVDDLRSLESVVPTAWQALQL